MRRGTSWRRSHRGEWTSIALHGFPGYWQQQYASSASYTLTPTTTSTGSNRVGGLFTTLFGGRDPNTP